MLRVVAVVLCFAIVAGGAGAGPAPAAGFEGELRLRTINTTVAPLANVAELRAGEVQSWRLDGTSTCAGGAVVVELWEDPATAAAATPMLQGSLLCPVVTHQSYDLLQQDAALQQQYQLWQAVAHTAAPQWNNATSLISNKSLHWDLGACARQLPYHWIVLEAAAATAQAHTWWVLVVNNRNTSVPEYKVRATCTAAPVTQHCPQPDPTGAPCSGAGTCDKAAIGKVTVPGCACRKDRTGVGCESELLELKPDGKPVRLQPSSDVNLRLVANSSLDTPWSLFQLQVDYRQLDIEDLRTRAVELELEMDWSGVDTVDQANLLTRPRLCFGSRFTEVAARPEPSSMYCYQPYNFPLEYRVSAAIFDFEVTLSWMDDYKGPMYILVMALGTAPMTLAARTETRSTFSFTCPFNCSGWGDVCGEFCFCECFNIRTPSGYHRGGNACQYVHTWNSSSAGIVDVHAGQRTWLQLNRYQPHDLQFSATMASGEPVPRDLQKQVLVQGYWMTGTSARQIPGDLVLLGKTNLTDWDDPIYPVLCVIKEATLDQFHPACKQKLESQDDLDGPVLVLMLRGAANLAPPVLWLNIVIMERPKRKQGLTKQRLAGALIGPVLLVAALAVVVFLVRKCRQVPQEGQPGAEEVQPAAAPRPPYWTPRGLPPHVIHGFPVISCSAPVATPFATKDRYGGVVEMAPTAVLLRDATANTTSSTVFGNADDVISALPDTHGPAGGLLAPLVGPPSAGTAASYGSGGHGKHPEPFSAAALHHEAVTGPYCDDGVDDRATSDRAAGRGRAGSTGTPTVCAICLGVYQPGELLRCLPCLHSFHCGCIDEWLASSGTCPTCRLDLMPQTVSGTVQPQPGA